LSGRKRKKWTSGSARSLLLYRKKKKVVNTFRDDSKGEKRKKGKCDCFFSLPGRRKITLEKRKKGEEKKEYTASFPYFLGGKKGWSPAHEGKAMEEE